MSSSMRVAPIFALLSTLGACTQPPATTDESGTSSATGTGSDTDTDTDEGSGSEDSGTETGEEPPEALETFPITHSFGLYALEPFEEVQPCVQWTLDNEASIYAQAVTLANRGYFHHANWFVVPEAQFAGPDGFFDCSERGFSELLAAATGVVLTAQSTQSFAETQRTRDGAVIKIPPGHKVVGATHMLNFGPAPAETELFMSLDLIHPRDVNAVLRPVRLNYGDLAIPPLSRSRFTGVCNDFAPAFEAGANAPIDIKLHYVLPHFHYLGDYFGLRIIGGEYDDQLVYELDGFNGEGNGRVFDPPLDLAGSEGFRFTCGYDNWRDEVVGFGVGDQEMCVMLALVEASGMADVSVNEGTVAVGEQDGIQQFEAPCSYFVVTPNPAQALPTQAERDGPLQLPPAGNDELPPVPECIDHDPGVAPAVEPTLSNVASVVFAQSCTFNACHGSASGAGGLTLEGPDLLANLLEHNVLIDPNVELVVPGNPDASWLYRVLSECAPQTSGGNIASHMPLNAPILLSDPSVALVREWIAAGALP